MDLLNCCRNIVPNKIGDGLFPQKVLQPLDIINKRYQINISSVPLQLLTQYLASSIFSSSRHHHIHLVHSSSELENVYADAKKCYFHIRYNEHSD